MSDLVERLRALQQSGGAIPIRYGDAWVTYRSADEIKSVIDKSAEEIQSVIAEYRASHRPAPRTWLIIAAIIIAEAIAGIALLLLVK